MEEKLAIYGGPKAKTTPNYPMYPGGLEIGEEEKKEVQIRSVVPVMNVVEGSIESTPQIVLNTEESNNEVLYDLARQRGMNKVRKLWKAQQKMSKAKGTGGGHHRVLQCQSTYSYT